jgi:hypothetical protein
MSSRCMSLLPWTTLHSDSEHVEHSNMHSWSLLNQNLTALNVNC